MSSSPAVARRIGHVGGSAPLRAPLPMIATVGRRAPVSSAAMPLNCPCTFTWYTSTVPIRFTGHTSSWLRCASRSARSSMRNSPNWNNSPMDWSSSTSRSMGAACAFVAHRGFGAPAPFRGLAQKPPRRRHYLDVHSRQGDLIPWRQHRVANLLPHFVIGVETLSVGAGGRTPRLPVVHDVTDGKPRRQRRNVSDVIDVEVRNHQVIELFQSGALQRSDDPFGGSCSITGGRPTGVQQHGLSRGGDEQHRLTPFHIDRVNVQRLRRSAEDDQGSQRNEK